MFVLTDSNSIEIEKFCTNKRIPCFVGNPRNGRGYTFLRSIEVDLILSINYLFIVENDIIFHPLRFAINFHGSKLPKYRGRTPHVWSIINGETEIGVTAHLITEECDAGAIVYQVPIKIDKDCTGAEVLRKFCSLYPIMIQEVIIMVETNRIEQIEQIHSHATFYAKRTPDDGLISWNWQKQRINNWVRAQANPYPGAFTYLKDTKVIINKIIYSKLGFDNSLVNGFVLFNGENPVIKTPNGAVEIVDYQILGNVKFEEGDILS
jgi:methionyl-tRNA formyltransferase